MVNCFLDTQYACDLLPVGVGGGQVPAGRQRQQILAHRQGHIPQSGQEGEKIEYIVSTIFCTKESR